jgi:hypothetical protein
VHSLFAVFERGLLIVVPGRIATQGWCLFRVLRLFFPWTCSTLGR